MPDPSQPPLLVLASRSPRRTQLLRDAGFTFKQADPPFNDPPQPDQAHPGPPATLAAYLAKQKALSLRPLIQPLAASHSHMALPPSPLILAADTLCVTAAGELIGTPADRDDARRMIQRFANHTHAVITAVALLGPDMTDPLTFADEAQVTLGPLNAVQLDEYLDSNQWQGKAGAYNLFERQHAGWPLSVIGDPTTVVGLPMRKLVPALAQRGIHPNPQ